MESDVSNILLCACYLTKSKGETDQDLLEVKHYILSQKGYMILVSSFVYFNLALLQCIRDSLDHLADPRLGCWHLIVLLLQLVRPTVSTLMNVGPRQWSSNLTAHWSFKNL